SATSPKPPNPPKKRYGDVIHMQSWRAFSGRGRRRGGGSGPPGKMKGVETRVNPVSLTMAATAVEGMKEHGKRAEAEVSPHKTLPPPPPPTKEGPRVFLLPSNGPELPQHVHRPTFDPPPDCGTSQRRNKYL
ncbi:hypothetical protein JOQ06_026263, partial [Pogonophryne albipinna]